MTVGSTRVQPARATLPPADGCGHLILCAVHRSPWANLLLRCVFEVEVILHPRCGGARSRLAAIAAKAPIELRKSAPRQASRVGAAGDGVSARGVGVTGARAPTGDAEWWVA